MTLRKTPRKEVTRKRINTQKHQDRPCHPSLGSKAEDSTITEELLTLVTCQASHQRPGQSHLLVGGSLEAWEYGVRSSTLNNLRIGDKWHEVWPRKSEAWSKTVKNPGLSHDSIS